MTRFDPSPHAHLRSAQRTATTLLLSMALMCACSPRAPDDAARKAELQRIQQACVDAMLRSSCSVMNGPEAAVSATVVYVAGLGPVDATAYRELRASGEAMCTVVHDACQHDWDSPRCKTARALWPGTANR